MRGSRSCSGRDAASHSVAKAATDLGSGQAAHITHLGSDSGSNTDWWHDNKHHVTAALLCCNHLATPLSYSSPAIGWRLPPEGLQVHTPALLPGLLVQAMHTRGACCKPRSMVQCNNNLLHSSSAERACPWQSPTARHIDVGFQPCGHLLQGVHHCCRWSP